ncbi:MAG: glycosyltransferase family 39 protein, partial [Chloroflexi bacterium]|nr:glycosyltransferase family 39 protein [Chloroflexota bacterium]
MSANRGGAGAALAWVVSALVLLAFAVRVYHLDYQSLWRDEVDALIFATRDLGTVLGNFTKVGENGPLYFLLLRLWVAASGTGEFSLRFFSAIFGVLIVPLAYAFGRRLVGREVGLFAALLVGVSPYSVWYAQEARMYALLAFMSLLSVAVYFRALEGGRPNPPAPFPPREGGAAERPTAAATTPLTVAGRGRGRGFPPRLLWPTYVVVTGLSLYVHFFAALVVLFEELLFVAGWARWRSAFRPWAMAFGLLVLPYLPLAAWQLPTILQPPPTAYPFLDPASIVAVLIRAWSLGFSPLPALVPLTVFVFLLLAGLVLYPARRGSFWFLVSGVWSKWCCPARVRGQASAAGSLPSAASRSPAEPAGSSPVVLSRCESIAGSAGSQSVMLSRSEASPRLEQATSGRCFAAAQHDNGGATRRVTGVPDARAAAQHDQAGIPPITHHSS